MDGWQNVDEMFNALHESNISYIILRNYEEIDAENFYTAEHPDVDFLTDKSKKVASVIKAIPRFVQDDGIHYKVLIAGVTVDIDVRSVGDGYYDKAWEKAMLNQRILKDNRFYIPDDINYYYSLVYHAVLQKKVLSDEYLCRLNQMAMRLGECANTEQSHLQALELFMRNNGYVYTYPYDIHVPFRLELVNENMVKKPINVHARDFKLMLLQFGSRIKHQIIKR